MHKWTEPCSICKGKSEGRCVLCGWKKKTKPKKRIVDEALQNRIEFLESIAQEMWNFNMETVSSKILLKDGTIANGDQGERTDSAVIRHLEWVERNILIPIDNGKSVLWVANATQLSTATIIRIIKNDSVRNYLNR